MIGVVARRFGDADGEICPVCRSLVGEADDYRRVLEYLEGELFVGSAALQKVKDVLKKWQGDPIA